MHSAGTPRSSKERKGDGKEKERGRSYLEEEKGTQLFNIGKSKGTQLTLQRSWASECHRTRRIG